MKRSASFLNGNRTGAEQTTTAARCGPRSVRPGAPGCHHAVHRRRIQGQDPAVLAFLQGLRQGVLNRMAEGDDGQTAVGGQVRLGQGPRKALAHVLGQGVRSLVSGPNPQGF